MSDRAKIILIYTVVTILSVATLVISLSIRKSRKERFDRPAMTEIGKEEPAVLLTLENDLVATNQDGEEVRLSDLKDKVWVATQFFANCPKCMEQNSVDLRRLYDEFKENPDFHVVSISVNPSEDGVEELKAYAKAIGADTRNWWFLTGPRERLYEFMEKEMKFMRIVENTEADATVRFSHDLGMEVFAEDEEVEPLEV